MKQHYGDFVFERLDLSDWDALYDFMQKNRFDAIIHFAAALIVPESVENPLKYYLNNTANTANLIQEAEKNGVKKFIFSSTAAVYGEPACVPMGGITEEAPTYPINPYGQSKLMSEQILKDTANAYIY